MRNATHFIAFALLACFAAPAAAQGMPEAGKLVTIEVVIADVPSSDQPEGGIRPAAIRELEAGGKLSSLMRIRMSGLENLQTQAQFGGDVPFVQGRSSFGRGGTAQTSFGTRSVGTIVITTSRVEEGGSVIVQYSIQRSRVEPPRATGEDDDPEAPPEVGVLNTQSTVRLKPGEPTIVGGRQTSSGADGSQTWIVMTASVEDAPRQAGAAAARPVTESRPATERWEGFGRTRGFGSFADRAEELARQSREFATPRRDAADARPAGERREQFDRDSARPRNQAGERPSAEDSDAPRPPAPADRGEARPARGPMQDIKVIQLEHASASNVADVLQRVFGAEPVRIASDPRSNSLIITGAPRALEVAIPLIQRLDEPRQRE